MSPRRYESVWLRGDEADGPGVRSIWEAAYAADPELPFVCGPEYSDLVNEAFRPPTEPITLLVTDHGSPVGLWPLATRKDPYWGGGVRRLCHRNEWHTFFSDPLIVGEDRDGIAGALFRAVASRYPADLLDIPRIRDLALPTVPVAGLTPIASPAVRHALPPPVWSKNRRQSVTQNRRRFAALPGATVEEYWDHDGVLAMCREFVSMHTTLKRLQNQWMVFDSIEGASERFPVAFARHTGTRSVSMLRLAADGKSIGLLLQVHRGAVTVAWRAAWDPAYARAGIGIVLNDEAVRLSRDRGDTVHHLGPGEEPYKLLWANEHAPVHRLRHRRQTPRLLLARLASRLRRGGSR